MSNSSLSRRSLVGTGSILLISPLAGCTPVHRPPIKRLVIYPSTDKDATSPDVERQDSTWIVNVTLVDDFSSRTESGNFHDVRVVGYSRQGERVCSEHVGAVTYENASFDDGVTAQMECSSFPYEITAIAREKPCDEGVEIQVLRYDDDRNIYRAEVRPCQRE